MSKRVCPNDPTHDEFIVLVMVGQNWKVDPYGNLMETMDYCPSVYSEPTDNEYWHCAICGEEIYTDLLQDDDEEGEPNE
jgi:hypothetical protein